MRENGLVADDINDTWSAYPRDMCVDEIFKARAARSPRDIALVHRNERITYQELDEASDRLANYIVDRGCGPEAIIGVCIQRSAEMIVAMLAVLKAGGAYLPLDTDYPVDRLRQMADHARCRLILGNTEQLAAFHGAGRPLLDLEEHRGGIRRARTHAPRPGRTSSRMAYVMYTSGTTGGPKGVVVEHRNISRLVLNTNYVHISKDDVFLQLAPIAFDASTFEIWGALLNGARLVLYDRPHMDVSRIEWMIKENGVSVLWLSAGFFNQVVEASPSIFKPVRQLLVGGDVLSVSHVAKVMERNPGCQVINGYGPTECTTFSVCFRVTPQSLQSPALPIGTPVSNSQVYIVDDELRPVGNGEVGELCIGGDGVSRGYLGSPELTAEKFVRIDDKGATRRVYRTGDLVRLGGDGNIYFLGRADRQLKVRGYRVEPAEVESAILACPGITQAVVVASVDRHGDKRLVAYIVGTSGEVPGSLELRETLRKVLPGHMIPATFVYLDKIPLTANGKVDRNLLPKPDWKPLASSPADSARTPMEKTVHAIWTDALGSEGEKGINTSIAAAGGSKGDLAKILERVGSRYGITVDGNVFAPDVTSVGTVVNWVRRRLPQHSSTRGEGV